ncbi:MAG: shikimate kinase [Aequorivita sp.]
MTIYLVGISCVGKTTIGKMLADRIDFTFFDLDQEIQNYFKKPIERIQDECFTMTEYIEKASIVLDNLLSKNMDSVISGTPSGLKFSYLQVYKKHKVNKELYSIFINDSLENILDRLTFYDKDSNPITEELSEPKKMRYLKMIKADYNYFKDSYKRADIEIDIENIRLKDIPFEIVEELKRNGIMQTTDNSQSL